MNYYNNHIVLILDTKGYIKSIVSNSNKDINIKEGDSIIRLFSSESHEAFYENFSSVLSDNLSLGFRANLANSANVFAFLLNGEESITLFCVQLHEDVVSLFDEIVQINNEQIRSIRTLYKQISSKTETTNFLDEIMLMNNALINTRRELNRKNRQLEQLNRTLEEINYTDYLTKIYNRRRFFGDVYTMVEKNDLLLVMMDFNNFKAINDELGHNKGDEVLILLTTEMKKELHPYNATLYRLGGDEFACLIPSQSQLDLDSMFKRIDAKLQEIHPKTGMAYGSVILTSETCNKTKKAELSMSVADEQMYKMKKAFYEKTTKPSH